MGCSVLLRHRPLRNIYIHEIHIHVYQGYKIGNRIGSVRYVSYSVACLDSVSSASFGVVRLENLVATFSCLAPLSFRPSCLRSVLFGHGISISRSFVNICPTISRTSCMERFLLLAGFSCSFPCNCSSLPFWRVSPTVYGFFLLNVAFVGRTLEVKGFSSI